MIQAVTIYGTASECIACVCKSIVRRAYNSRSLPLSLIGEPVQETFARRIEGGAWYCVPEIRRPLAA
jgi:hypothetical protein